MTRPPASGRSSVDQDAERRRRALSRALTENNMRAADAARAADLGNPNSIYNFMAGRTKSLSAETYRRLAKVIPNASVASLQGLESASHINVGRTVTVKAEARMGVLRPSFDLPPNEQTDAPVPIDPAMRAAGAFGVVVRPPGAELLYPEGTILVVMPLPAFDGSLGTGRRVVLQRINGRNVEVSVRELQVIDGKAWLRTRSTDPRFDGAVDMPWPGDAERMWKRGEDRYSIAGVVIGSYIPEL